MRWLRVGAALAAAAALAGCASVPHASHERDAEAKRFLARPEAATLYVFRNDFGMEEWDLEDSVLYVNDRLIGGTLPGTYFRIDVRAGTHLLHGFAYDQGRLKVEARSGEITFVSLNVSNGTSEFARVAPEKAKAEIARCCVLLENWTAGQRPLLY